MDIQQIFGRAGRPQFQESGVAMLICEHEKLVRYLGLLMHQLPIESQFIKELPNRTCTPRSIQRVERRRCHSAWI